METSCYYRKDLMEDYISVVDVYDSAALIGKDFEYLIEQFGVEAVTELMPKVIRVLEQLEYLAGKHEKENEELLQLETTIQRLHTEKEERAKERQQYEKDMEQIEESYQLEKKDLCQRVANLQDQNRKLQSRLNDNVSGQEAAIEKTEEDFNVIQALKETVSKQRGQIKGLQKDVQRKESEVDSMRKLVDQLTIDNQSLRNSTSTHRAEIDRLLAEHYLLQTALHEKDQQILAIRASRAAHDKSRHGSASTESEASASSNLIGQVVGNMPDHDNPRFTLNELKDVLTERNTLKSKLIEVEEELSYYKTKAKEADGDTSWLEEEQASAPEVEEEPYVGPVQGPINREPWEKLHPDGKPESGIRKFFKFLGFERQQRGRQCHPHKEN